MAIESKAVTRAKCDACPQVVYAEDGAQPKGIQGHVRDVDGNGRETNAGFFACQPNHIGAAAKAVLIEAKKGRGQVLPNSQRPSPTHEVIRDGNGNVLAEGPGVIPDGWAADDAAAEQDDERTDY